jgi:DNA invertase Pin-like site-specific DNA recombinase
MSAADAKRAAEIGCTSNRSHLKKAIAALTEMDTLLVTRVDRLARSTRDLLNILASIADKGAGFKSLGDEWADTATPHFVPITRGNLSHARGTK